MLNNTDLNVDINNTEHNNNKSDQIINSSDNEIKNEIKNEINNEVFNEVNNNIDDVKNTKNTNIKNTMYNTFDKTKTMSINLKNFIVNWNIQWTVIIALFILFSFVFTPIMEFRNVLLYFVYPTFQTLLEITANVPNTNTRGAWLTYWVIQGLMQTFINIPFFGIIGDFILNRFIVFVTILVLITPLGYITSFIKKILSKFFHVKETADNNNLLGLFYELIRDRIKASQLIVIKNLTMDSLENLKSKVDISKLKTSLETLGVNTEILDLIQSDQMKNYILTFIKTSGYTIFIHLLDNSNFKTIINDVIKNIINNAKNDGIKN